MLSVLFAWRWWALRKEAREARYRALQHLAVVAQALYTGSTAGYEMFPDLPRAKNSTDVGWSSHIS